MEKLKRIVSVGSRIVLFSVFAVVALQGCVEKGGIVVNPVMSWCDKNDRVQGTGGRGPRAPGGCDSVFIDPAVTVSAQGFIGVGGANPVPAGFSCLTGELCDPAGKKCNRNDTKHCRDHYYYSTGECACICVAP